MTQQNETRHTKQKREGKKKRHKRLDERPDWACSVKDQDKPRTIIKTSYTPAWDKTTHQYETRHTKIKHDTPTWDQHALGCATIRTYYTPTWEHTHHNKNIVYTYETRSQTEMRCGTPKGEMTHQNETWHTKMRHDTPKWDMTHQPETWLTRKIWHTKMRHDTPKWDTTHQNETRHTKMRHDAPKWDQHALRRTTIRTSCTPTWEHMAHQNETNTHHIIW